MQRGPFFQLGAHSFAAGMQALSECAGELEDQLDRLPMLSDRHLALEIEKCSRIAMRAAGLIRLIADTTSAPCVEEIELDIEDFMGSLQDLAGGMKAIECCLGEFQRRECGELLNRTHGAVVAARSSGA
jgi:hypothetical protein